MFISVIMLSTSPKFILIFLIFCLTFIPSLKGFGQKGYFPGYIVSNFNDTIPVKIKITNQEKNSCVYIDLNDKTCTADPATVKAFAIKDGRQYRYLKYDHQSNGVDAYFEVLVSGRICLFSYNKRLFIQKNNGEIIELLNTIEDIARENGTNFIRNKREYVGILKFLLSDSEYTILDLTDIDLAKKDLIQIIRIYNEGERFVQELEKQKYKPYFKIGIELLLANEKFRFRFPSIKYSDEYQGQFLLPGLGLKLKYQYTPNFSLNTGVQMKYLDYSIYKSYGSETLLRYYTLKNNFVSFELPLLIEYELNKLELHPSIGFGAQIEKSFSNNTSCLEETNFSSNSDIFSYEHQSLFSNPVNSYLMFKIGGFKDIGKNSVNINIQFIKDISDLNSKIDNQFYHKSGFKLSCGVMF